MEAQLKFRRPRDGLRNHPGNPDDYDVIDGDGHGIGAASAGYLLIRQARAALDLKPVAATP